MLALYELPSGYALFKVTGSNVFQLHAFHKFKDPIRARDAAEAIMKGKLASSLKKFLKSSIVQKEIQGELAVADKKLAAAITKKLSINCVFGEETEEMFRAIREKITDLVEGLTEQTLKQMSLGLAHTLNRHILKFRAEKLDVMVIQAVGLLDDLDKELNTYAMRVKEWYGWHFPEMQKAVQDNIQYSRVVLHMGYRHKAAETDFSGILSDETAELVKAASITSMGVEISETDLEHIQDLATEVVATHGYRSQLADYLKGRMQAIAPNLTTMVGELIGARLISQAGSLMNLAKAPASTLQLLGAEKALFRALKSKHETPKYGLLFHVSYVGQASARNRGKVARMVANRSALCTRVDALTEGRIETPTVGAEGVVRVEARMRALESGEGGKRKAEDGAGGAPKRQRTF
jgi:nucleolar protein 58